MYKLTITTKYNIIELNVEDYTTPEVQEILQQPYVVVVEMEKTDAKENQNVKPKKKTKHLQQ